MGNSILDLIAVEVRDVVERVRNRAAAGVAAIRLKTLHRPAFTILIDVRRSVHRHEV